MSANPWTETSRKIYAVLLSLYPKEHRDDYATPMQQVFNEQCRNAYEQKGQFGILLLWLRTLPDLGYTALLEHVTSPRAVWGLMEPVPNAPLPWKGVFLILLPGLVYLISQVAQLITGETWFYFVYYRVTFLLIIPPLFAWIFTRRFPLWGLIPLGLLFRVMQEIGYQLIVWHPKLFSGNPILEPILKAARQINENLWLLVTPLTLVTLVLGLWHIRQQKNLRRFWGWLGVYALVACLKIGQEYISLAQNMQQYPDLYTGLEATKATNWLSLYASWVLYPTTTLLLLIFIGMFFTRRHGFFAILLLVGYILPTSLIGMQDFESFPNPTLALTIFSFAILAYRATLTLVAPIWMSRTASQTSKKRIILACIAAALIIHALTQFYPAMLYDHQVTPDWIIAVALDELKLISAFLLAISMYQNNLQVREKEGCGPALNHKRVSA
jgi:hypothetical protein